MNGSWKRCLGQGGVGLGGTEPQYLPGVGPSQPSHVVQLPQSSLHPIVQGFKESSPYRYD